MNSTTANSSSTIEIPAVTSKDDSSSPRPVPPAPSISGTRSGASRAARPRPSTGGRCQHLFPNGKRCRKYATDSHFGLCLHHFTVSAALGAARQQDQSDFTDLSADLLPELSEFSAGADIRQFLARLLTLVTKGRISPAVPPSSPTSPTNSSTPTAPSSSKPPRPTTTRRLSLTSPAPIATGPTPNLLLQVTTPLQVTPSCLGSHRPPRPQARLTANAHDAPLPSPFSSVRS